MKWRFARLFFVLSVLLVTPQAAAMSAESKIELSGVVLPVISVYVNEAGEIEEIFNNSSADAEAKAFSYQEKSKPLPFSSRTEEEYLALKSTHDFNKYGLVYKKPESIRTTDNYGFLERYFRLSVFGF